MRESPAPAKNQERGNAPGEAGFEEIEHTADRAFHVSGTDPAALFTNAAKALFGAHPNPLAGGQSVQREVEISGPDRESLLVSWLNELLYLQEAHGEWYSDFQVAEASANRIRARVRGRKQATANRTIKAVTFHNLNVRHEADGWHATVVVDV